MVSKGYSSYIGKQIKGYTILQKLGSGGSAHVYLARNHLKKLVAIKFLNPEYINPESQQLFFQEARFLQDLKTHQHVLPILDYGESEGRPYIVVEYAPGGTLRERINASRPVSIDEALIILMQVGKAVDAIHQHQIVHCDLKPENILFDGKGNAILADFGIAIQLGGNEKFYGLPRGTYAYMAPEQFDGVFTKEGDQYSLGCVAYELLTGRHPFEYILPFNPYDRQMVKERHQSARILPLREFNRAVPDHIEQVILQSIAKKPSKRHNIVSFMRGLQPSTFLPLQLAHHFTRTIDTPPSSSSALEHSQSPPNTPENTALSSNRLKVCEMVQSQVSYHEAACYSHDRSSPGPTFPKNMDENPIRTDAAIPHSEIVRSTTDRIHGDFIGFTPPNLLQTLNLQLPQNLKALLSPSLKALGYTLCQAIVKDQITYARWKYTAITRNEKNNPVPQYALVYIPDQFLNDENNIHAIRGILSLFSHWTLIIFSHSRGLAPPTERLLEAEKKTRQITLDQVVEQRHIDELREKKAARKDLITDYLKLNDLPLPLGKVSAADIGILEDITAKYLLDFRRDIQNFFKSDDLREIAANLDLKDAPGIIATRAIRSLNEPPYQTDNTRHTLLGEFLCGLLGEGDFPEEGRKEVKGIIRKYTLSPSSCQCYRS